MDSKGKEDKGLDVGLNLGLWTTLFFYPRMVNDTLFVYFEARIISQLLPIYSSSRKISLGIAEEGAIFVPLLEGQE